MKRSHMALAAIALSCLVVLAVLLSADTYSHAKFENSGAVNRWGYRGPVLGAKEDGEYRVIVLGDSTVFGYGVRWYESWPAQLETMLRSPHQPDRHMNVGRSHITVINLGYNSEASYALAPTLEDYAWLQPDLVLLYAGYNDLGGFNTALFRHDSFVFRWTGYMPILPLVVHEKLLSLRYGGYLDAAYHGDKVVFRPGFSDRVMIAGLSQADRIAQTLASPQTKQLPFIGKSKIDWYLNHMDAAIAWCVGHGLPVLVISQPTYSAMHREQQDQLSQHLNLTSFARHVDLSDAIGDLHDTRLASDGIHLTAAGNKIIATALLDPVLEEWEEAMSLR